MAPLDRDAVMRRIEELALIAVIRADSAGQALDACRALRDGGVLVQEIAMTTPDGVRAIEQAAAELGDTCLIGAGTVLDTATAGDVIAAGAQFVFAPNVNLDVIARVRELDRIVVPGALTPTEITAAWQAGADVIKLFPANYFGPRYIRDIHGPLPDVRIAPTGGVTLENAGAWLAAGAVAVGVGSEMVRKDLIRRGDWKALSDLAGGFAAAVAAARPAAIAG